MVTFKVFSRFFFSMLDVCLQFVGFCFTLIWNSRRLLRAGLLLWSQSWCRCHLPTAEFSSTKCFSLCGCSGNVSQLFICWHVLMLSETWSFMFEYMDYCSCTEMQWQMAIFDSPAQSTVMLNPHRSIFVLCLCADGGPCNLSGTSLLVSPTSLSVSIKIVEVCSLHMTYQPWLHF